MKTWTEIPAQRPATPQLDRIDSPADLRRLPADALPGLADELRAFLMYCVGQTGGHLGAGLGVVELTLALHHTFDTPHDRLIWDVGHQAYPHKILTGRREAMLTLRQVDGVAGFPSRDESEFDAFGTGHSSTSISAALGMAIAEALRSKSAGPGAARHIVAVIGDGALTAGLSFEALNHAAEVQANLLVVVNDNAMAISRSVGGLARYFERHDQTAGALFEALGFAYHGPVDGHDLDALTGALEEARAGAGPRLLHVRTRKGRGYQPAEDDPVAGHSLTKIEPIAGSAPPRKPSFSNVFGQWLVDRASDPRLIAITPAMREGSDLVAFSQQSPERYFDVAIAEQHACTLAAGLATEGLKPIVAIYSTFLQRAYDQLVHDIAVQDLDVTLAIDRAGLVEDGATHAGLFDIAMLRAVPGVAVLTPSDEAELRLALETAWQHPGAAAVRYPRGSGPGATPAVPLDTFPWGRGRISRAGSRVALLAFGPLLRDCGVVAERHGWTVADMRFVKPLDGNLIDELAAGHDLLVTVEEHMVAGGAGSAVLEYLTARGAVPPVELIGLDDTFPTHGPMAAQHRRHGLDAAGIERRVLARLERDST